MVKKSRVPIVNDAWFLSMLIQSLGDRFQNFRNEPGKGPLQDLEDYESILYSLDKQDLILIMEVIQTFSTTFSPRRALYALVNKLTEVLDISHCSLILINLEREQGIVAVSHEDPDFEGVQISLNGYPEILRSLKTGEITIVKNPTKEPLMHSLKKEQMQRIQDISIMVLPLSYMGKVFCTLLVRKQRSEEGFSIREVRICQLIVHVVLRFLQKACGASSPAGAFLEQEGIGAEEGTESRQQERDAMFHAMLFRAVPMGVFLLDGEGNIVRANPRASEICGVALERLLTMNYDDIVSREWVRDILARRGGAGPVGEEMSRYHVSYVAPDGNRQVLSVERCPLPGETSFSWVFFRDVTREKSKGDLS